MDMTPLMISIVCGMVGTGMFMYGKSQQKIPCLAAGVALMICPYLIPNLIALGIVAVLLTAIPLLIG